MEHTWNTCASAPSSPFRVGQRISLLLLLGGGGRSGALLGLHSGLISLRSAGPGSSQFFCSYSQLGSPPVVKLLTHYMGGEAVSQQAQGTGSREEGIGSPFPIIRLKTHAHLRLSALRSGREEHKERLFCIGFSGILAKQTRAQAERGWSLFCGISIS